MRWWDIEAAHAVERELFPDAWSPETFWSELAGVPETRYYVVAEAGPTIVGYAGLAVVGLQADVHELLVDVLEDDVDAGGRDRLGDLTAHGSCADHRGLEDEHGGRS